MLALMPLVGPECRWAVARLWVFVLRWVAALVILSVVLVTSWFCWFTHILDPAYLPGSVLRISLTIAVGLTLTFVLLLAPAVLAGAFTGDSERGKLGILLSTRVSAGEIVFSRFVSRLCQVGVVAASGLPGVCLLAAYCGIGPRALAVLLLLTTAVASGSAGIALSFSVLFNRARDALIGAYAVGLSLMFLPMMGSIWIPVAISPWFQALNPFWCLGPLIESSQLGPAWQSILVWSALASVGVLSTSWLLRPAYLRRAGGNCSIARRRRHVPPLGDCPIRWKELYIEADKNFGRLVRVLGQFALLLMLGGSLLLLTLFIWSSWGRQSPEIVEDVLRTAAVWIKTISLPMSWLVQWAVGIRAAAGIADEKERGTWDALLMTPLGGGQIVRAKMFESFYSLRWFLAATLIVWLLGVLLEAVDFYGFAALATSTVAYVGFMSAVGVWSSLFATTSARAITLTLAIWLAGKIVFTVAAVLLVLVAMLIHYLVWSASEYASGRTPGISPQPLMSFNLAMTIFELALCVGTAILIAWYCHARFDRLAGRCPERAMPVRVLPT